MNRPVYYYLPHVSSSKKLRRPFMRGFGADVVQHTDVIEGRDYCMFGDPTLWDTMLAGFSMENQRTFYVDHAYLKRFTYYRMTINALQHNGIGYDDPTRFSKLNIKIMPWRKKGDKILVCPPDRIFADLIGLNVAVWLTDVIATLKQNTDRKIVIRTRHSSVPLQKHIRDSYAVVTHMSNIAVDAIIDGVPVFLTGESAASPMALSDLTKIEEPNYPDNRRQWASVLANNQWTPDEIASGLCKRMLLTQEEMYGNQGS